MSSNLPLESNTLLESNFPIESNSPLESESEDLPASPRQRLPPDTRPRGFRGPSGYLPPSIEPSMHRHNHPTSRPLPKSRRRVHREKVPSIFEERGLENVHMSTSLHEILGLPGEMELHSCFRIASKSTTGPRSYSTEGMMPRDIGVQLKYPVSSQRRLGLPKGMSPNGSRLSAFC